MSAVDQLFNILFKNGIISFIINFIVLYILFQVCRWFILPHLKIGVYALPPQVVWRTLWAGLTVVLNAVFHWVLAILFCIYVIWMIIKRYVPEMILFIPLRAMLLAIPPFPPLEQAGILPLIDDIVNIIFSGDSFMNRIRRFFIAIYNFFRNAGRYVIELLGGSVGYKPPERIEPPPPPTNEIKADQEEVPDDPETLSTQDKSTIRAAYLACLEKNVAPIPANMATFDKIKLMLNNQGVTAQCQLDSFNAYSKVISLHH